MSTVKLTVNGKAVSADVEDRTLLVHLLREHLNLTGTHVGCDTSQCGACVVHIDGRAVKSCTVLAGQAAGSQRHHHRGHRRRATSCIRCRPRSATITGCSAVICTPGMIMSAIDIVNRHGGKLDEDDRPARAGRQHLPLHRLPQYRQIGARRRRPHEGCAGGGIVRGLHDSSFEIRKTDCGLRLRDFGADDAVRQGEMRWVLRALAPA